MKIATAAYPLDPLTSWAEYAAKLTNWVADAAGNGAELLVFPEYGAMELAMLSGPEVAGDLAVPAVVEAGAYPDLFTCAGEDDWYAIEVDEAQRLTVAVEFDAAAGDLELALYGPDGVTIIDESTGLQGAEEVELLRAPAPGTYFVRVYLVGQGEVNRYRLDVNIAVAEACPDDPYEPNGALDGASLLPDGVHDLRLCPGDTDWFRFAVPAGNTVRWQVSSGQAGVRIALYDQDGELLDEDDRSIAHEARYNGFYYLQATVESVVDVAYQLRVSGV